MSSFTKLLQRHFVHTPDIATWKASKWWHDKVKLKLKASLYSLGKFTLLPGPRNILFTIKCMLKGKLKVRQLLTDLGSCCRWQPSHQLLQASPVFLWVRLVWLQAWPHHHHHHYHQARLCHHEIVSCDWGSVADDTRTVNWTHRFTHPITMSGLTRSVPSECFTVSLYLVWFSHIFQLPVQETYLNI